jgi:hypothetical protein
MANAKETQYEVLNIDDHDVDVSYDEDMGMSLKGALNG